jgi:hypothetical protein
MVILQRFSKTTKLLPTKVTLLPINDNKKTLNPFNTVYWYIGILVYWYIGIFSNNKIKNKI